MKFFRKKTPDMNSNKPNPVLLSKRHAWFLMLCQCLNLGVIAIEIKPWMLAIISLCLFWQAILLFNNREQSEKPVNAKATTNKNTNTLSALGLVFFAILGCVAIAATGKQTGLLGSMIHLLCFSYALKAFELKTRSDFYQLILLGVFIIAASLIFRQNLAFSIVIIGLLILNLVCLLQFFSFEKSIVKDIKVTAILLGQSAVLAIVLFLVFPRIPPFWQMPLAKSAETGLSDTVKPGDIAKLTQSNKLAFRADFGENKVPSYSQLYWRAMVLEEYDGRQWGKSNFTKNYERTGYKKAKVSGIDLSFDSTNTKIKPLTYQVILEPSFQKHLVALAPAVTRESDSSVIPSVGLTFRSNSIITQAKSYQLTSYLTAPLSLSLTTLSKRQNLNYPLGSNPRLEKLAEQLAKQYPEPLSRAQAILSSVNQNAYFYTLEPPLLNNNSLDQFFFDTKAGFCVHYASAFTFIMRASGVPSRIVTGYLGGEFNPANNSDVSEQGHLSIYQYDAHAWSEIWIENKGWVRVDPTSAVDPQRVNAGFSTQLMQERAVLNNDLFSLYQLKSNPLFNAIRLQFDALDYQWTRWVIGFNAKQQYDLFKQWFGNKSAWKLAMIIGAALFSSMLILVLSLQFINRTKQIKRPLVIHQQLYNKALRKLAKEGITKPQYMTVNEFAKYVREQSPQLALVFTRFTSSFSKLNYSELTEEDDNKLTVILHQQYDALIDKLKNIKNH